VPIITKFFFQLLNNQRNPGAKKKEVFTVISYAELVLRLNCPPVSPTKKNKKDQYYFSFPAAIFPPYVRVHVCASACVRASVCVCVCVCKQYNERILFQQKGTSRWYTQSTPIHHHRRASVFPRPSSAPPLIAN